MRDRVVIRFWLSMRMRMLVVAFVSAAVVNHGVRQENMDR